MKIIHKCASVVCTRVCIPAFMQQVFVSWKPLCKPLGMTAAACSEELSPWFSEDGQVWCHVETQTGSSSGGVIRCVCPAGLCSCSCVVIATAWRRLLCCQSSPNCKCHVTPQLPVSWFTASVPVIISLIHWRALLSSDVHSFLRGTVSLQPSLTDPVRSKD